jgi:hypothetical protein
LPFLQEHDDELGDGRIVHESGPESEEDEETSPKRGGKNKKRDASALRKAPQAPKRFKSSYICFFMSKQAEIKEELGDKATVTAISKRSAELWKHLPTVERAHWDDIAAKDKQRYMVEKASYTGPWQVPWKRAKKDPSAPKRPMSAFLFFSQGRRSEIKKQNPELKNTEVSRLLGRMWRTAPEEERNPHIEKEKGERAKYKVAIAAWRKEADAKAHAQLKAQAQQQAMHPVHEQGPPGMGYPDQYGNIPPGPPGYMYSGYPPYRKCSMALGNSLASTCASPLTLHFSCFFYSQLLPIAPEWKAARRSWSQWNTSLPAAAVRVAATRAARPASASWSVRSSAAKLRRGSKPGGSSL